MLPFPWEVLVSCLVGQFPCILGLHVFRYLVQVLDPPSSPVFLFDGLVIDVHSLLSYSTHFLSIKSRDAGLAHVVARGRATHVITHVQIVSMAVC